MCMVAYICDGLVPECSGHVGCFKFPSASFDDLNVCHHTFDCNHAVFGASLHPEDEVPDRFVKFVCSPTEIRYFELMKN